MCVDKWCFLVGYGENRMDVLHIAVFIVVKRNFTAINMAAIKL
jgi:hypothetical protein